MGLFKVACHVLVASGLAGPVNFLFAMNAPDARIQPLLPVNTIVLYIQGLCPIIAGYGMCQGRSEFAEEASSG